MGNMPKRLQLLKSFPSGSGGSGSSGAQPDLNAAEGEPGHVLNRTHWVDFKRVDVLPVDSFALDESAWCEVHLDRPIVAGKTYVISCNGVEYERKAIRYADYECICIGSLSVQQDGAKADSNDDFFAFSLWDDGLTDICFTIDEYASKTIVFSMQELEEVIHKLPSEFLPETVGAVPDLIAIKGEPGHVLHRTHYSEYVTTIADNLSVMSGYYAWINYAIVKDQEEVRIIYDGAVYDCPVTVIKSITEYGDESYFYIGNWRDNAPEYPFFIMGYLGNEAALVNVGEGTHTISVKLSEVVKKLDKKYLPFGYKQYTLEYAASDLTPNDAGEGDSFNASEVKQTEALNLISELSSLNTISINLSVSVPTIGEIMRIPAMLHVKNEANGIDGCLSAFSYEGTVGWWIDGEKRVPVLGGISIYKTGMTVVPANWYQIISTLGATIVVDVLHA